MLNFLDKNLLVQVFLFIIKKNFFIIKLSLNLLYYK
jgi:hypothetical protein